MPRLREYLMYGAEAGENPRQRMIGFYLDVRLWVSAALTMAGYWGSFVLEPDPHLAFAGGFGTMCVILFAVYGGQ